MKNGYILSAAMKKLPDKLTYFLIFVVEFFAESFIVKGL